MRRRFVLLLLISSSLILSLIWVEAALTQDEEKVELTPSSVELPSSGEVESQLILRNKSQRTFEGIKVVWFTDSGATVKIDESQELVDLPPGAETFWPLKLSQSADGLVPGNIYFRISYKSSGVPQVLYATLGVNNRQTDEVDKVVSVTPKTSSTLLNEQRPGQVFLVINNKSNHTINIKEIKTKGPNFIEGTPDVSHLEKNPQGELMIQPRDSVNVPVTIKVIDSVRPGKHLLMFEVPVSWGVKGHLQSANLIAQQEFDVGILGESEILTALGVPSFLILPGFLIILGFGLLTNLSKGETLKGDSVLRVGANPYFWVIAITLSGVMAFLYPIGTKFLRGTPRDYLVGYGLYDVVLVWLASIMIGTVAWVLLQMLRSFWSWLFAPSGNDEPETVLRKLYFQGLGTSLEQVDLTIGSETLKVFLLQSRKKQRSEIWAGPFIQIRWLKAVQNETLKQLIDKQLEPPEKGVLKPVRLLWQWCRLQWFFWKGKKQGELELAWNQLADLTWPRLIATPTKRGTRITIIQDI